MSLDQTFLVTLSAALSALAYLPYTLAILRGVVQPHRASWLIWLILSLAAVAVLLGAGAAMGAVVFAGAQAFGCAVVCALSVRRGVGALLTGWDGLTLMLCLGGLCLWGGTAHAGYAMALIIAIGAIGGALTVIKAYRAPGSEAVLPWLLHGAAALVGAAAVAGTSPIAMSYPIYLIGLYAAILGAMVLGRSRAGGPARFRPHSAR